MKADITKADRKKYAPDAMWIMRFWCYAVGHIRPDNENGWTAIYCERCGKSSIGMRWRDYPKRWVYRLQWGLVNLANALEMGATPTNRPPFRRVDGKHLMNLGTEHTCDAYSYEHLKSMVDQGDDQLLSRFLSEDGWVNITEANAEQMVEEINASFEHEANRQEREKTMKMMRGELPHPESSKQEAK